MKVKSNNFSSANNSKKIRNSVLRGLGDKNLNFQNIKIFSFFSGVGFLDLGFEKADFDISYVNEVCASFLKGYKYARRKMGIKPPTFGYYDGSIEDFLNTQKGAHLSSLVNKAKSTSSFVGFIGGPPCPDFSVGGKNRGKKGENGRLSETYVDVIIDRQPDFFVFENVKGLWRTKRHRKFYEELKNKLKNAGYYTSEKLINAISYGVPQDRDRIILIGFKDFLVKHLGNSLTNEINPNAFFWDKYSLYGGRSAFDFPWPQKDKFIPDKTRKKPNGFPIELTVEHWFKKNNVNKHPNNGHCFRPKAGLKKFLIIEEGDDSRKSFKRLHRWRYSPTACYGNNEVHLHPYKPRRISVSEALAIQSLEKEFELPADMSLTDMFKTIGNGVPFLVAYYLAMTIRDFIKEKVDDEINSFADSEGGCLVTEKQVI